MLLAWEYLPGDEYDITKKKPKIFQGNTFIDSLNLNAFFFGDDWSTNLINIWIVKHELLLYM